uniref:Uncharacterized protein n=1 Tax=Anguilla anguilla TaxID=7936 RepID=A0A0E9SUQ2_ANGAN
MESGGASSAIVLFFSPVQWCKYFRLI